MTLQDSASKYGSSDKVRLEDVDLDALGGSIHEMDIHETLGDEVGMELEAPRDGMVEIEEGNKGSSGEDDAIPTMSLMDMMSGTVNNVREAAMSVDGAMKVSGNSGDESRGGN